MNHRHFVQNRTVPQRGVRERESECVRACSRASCSSGIFSRGRRRLNIPRKSHAATRGGGGRERRQKLNLRRAPGYLFTLPPFFLIPYSEASLAVVGQGRFEFLFLHGNEVVKISTLSSLKALVGR